MNDFIIIIIIIGLFDIFKDFIFLPFNILKNVPKINLDRTKTISSLNNF